MIAIQVKGLEEVAKQLKNMTDNQTKQKILHGASSLSYGNVIKHFSDQSGPDGNWAPWSVNYQKRMERKGNGGNRLLQDTGYLRQSITPAIRDDSVFIRADAEYAAVHNFGSAKKNIPQREFMFIDDDVIGKLEKYIRDTIVQSYTA